MAKCLGKHQPVPSGITPTLGTAFISIESNCWKKYKEKRINPSSFGSLAGRDCDISGRIKVELLNYWIKHYPSPPAPNQPCRHRHSKSLWSSVRLWTSLILLNYGKVWLSNFKGSWAEGAFKINIQNWVTKMLINFDRSFHPLLKPKDGAKPKR